MQDKLTQKKTEEQGEARNDGVARALSSLYKSAINEEDLQVQREDASYYRKLARPRSEKYLELMSREMQIAERLGVLYKQLEENGGSVTATPLENTTTSQPALEWWQQDVKPLQTAETSSSNEMSQGNPPDIGTFAETVHTEQIEQSVQTEAVSEQPATQEWWQTDVQKQQQAETVDNSAILAEIAQLKSELAEVRTALEAEMPVGHGRLGVIYRSDMEGKLITLGAIAAAGNPFGSVDELLGQVKPQSEQEKRQWVKGNAAYREVNGECLVVEIYLTAVCVVFEDGSVKSYRD